MLVSCKYDLTCNRLLKKFMQEFVDVGIVNHFKLIIIFQKKEARTKLA